MCLGTLELVKSSYSHHTSTGTQGAVASSPHALSRQAPLDTWLDSRANIQDWNSRQQHFPPNSGEYQAGA